MRHEPVDSGMGCGVYYRTGTAGRRGMTLTRSDSPPGPSDARYADRKTALIFPIVRRSEGTADSSAADHSNSGRRGQSSGGPRCPAV